MGLRQKEEAERSGWAAEGVGEGTQQHGEGRDCIGRRAGAEEAETGADARWALEHYGLHHDLLSIFR